MKEYVENIVEVLPFGHHNKMVTGTTISAVMKVNPFMTPFQVYDSIVNNNRPDTATDYARKKMRAGVKLERAIYEMYVEDTGNKTLYVPDVWKDATFRVKQRPVDIPLDFGGTPDGLIELPNGDKIILEIKNIGYRQAKNFSETEVPYYYHLQAMWYTWLWQADGFQFAYLVDGYDFRTTDIIKRDNDLIGMMFESAEKFYNDYISKKTPPPPQTRLDVLTMYPESTSGKQVVAPQEVFDACKYLGELKVEKKEIDDSIKEVQNVITAFMEDAELLYDEAGNKLLSFKSFTKKMLDTKRLRADHPDLCDQYTKETIQRTLR